MKHKKLFIAFVAVFSVLVCLGTFILVWFWGDVYPDFDDFKESAAIPGLNEGAVPQGLANYTTNVYAPDGAATDEKQDYLFISAYMKEGPSRIYVTGVKTGYVGYVTMECYNPGDADANSEGYVPYYGHAGGIATSCKQSERNGTLWMVSDGKVWCFKGASEGYTNPAEELIAKAKLYGQPDENGAAQNVIRFKTSFEANCRASFCFFYEDGSSSVSNDKLYVGEFYRAGDKNYSTDADHHLTTKQGTQNHAFMYEYTLNTDTSNAYGLSLISASTVAEENRVPKVQAVYSIPDKIQGGSRVPLADSTSTYSGALVLAESYGLANSRIYYYDFAKIHDTSNRDYYSDVVKFTDAEGNKRGKNFIYKGVKKTLSGQEYDENPPIYYIDASLLEREYSVPSMAEGMCVINRNVYVLFESGSYKYRMFVRREIKNIFRFIPRR